MTKFIVYWVDERYGIEEDFPITASKHKVILFNNAEDAQAVANRFAEIYERPYYVDEAYGWMLDPGRSVPYNPEIHNR